MTTPANKAMLPVGETREAMFARIRSALSERVAAEDPKAPAVDATLVRLCEPTADLAARFEKQATAVGLHVRRVSESSIIAALAAILQGLSDCGVVLDVEDAKVAEWAEAALQAAGAARIGWEPEMALAAHFRADVSITDVDATIADSGSLVLSSGPERSRASHLLAPIHIAIVRTEQVHADHVDFWQHQAKATEAAATVLITGPSKTADIEGVLVTGVHGPGTVHVLLVD
ncbi:MAG: lactate utilization protein C [Phycisphaerales bacterium JB038]